MSKRFENQFDKDREVKAIEAVLSGTPYTYEKLGDHDLDFIIKDENGTPVLCCEVKGRNKNLEDAYPLPLAARKIVSMADNKLPGLIVWDCLDGIIHARVNDIKGTCRMGGRKPRQGAANDVEWMSYFPEQPAMKTIVK